MPMRPPLSPKDQSTDPRHPLIRGLERAAVEINPFLAILAIGIAILDLTCYVGVVGTRQLVPHSTAYAATTPPAPTDAGPIDYRR
jgi:hypothetical protein